MVMACDEKLRLLAEYNSAVVDASTAARTLAELAGRSTGDDFKFLNEEKQRANLRLKKARETYQHHTLKHECGQP
jgi:hypothetical protein